MILAIDAGNSRIKWGLHDGGGWAHRGAVDTVRCTELNGAWRQFKPPEAVIGSNVAGEKARASIEQALGAWQMHPLWIEAQAAQCGVRSSYNDPRQLGPDRWAALIGAWHCQRGACLVVNAGTAMTVDALSDEGLFLGGIIVPGIDLMRVALARNTAALKVQEGAVSFFPNNTGDAIMSGAVHALSGAIERLALFMHEAGQPQPVCVLSGGDARLLAPHIAIEVKRVDNLVLEGLIGIARQ